MFVCVHAHVCAHMRMFVLGEDMWVLDVTVGSHVYECVCKEKCM